VGLHEEDAPGLLSPLPLGRGKGSQPPDRWRGEERPGIGGKRCGEEKGPGTRARSEEEQRSSLRVAGVPRTGV